jgi:FlaA1/EpsC-like NDP-sugar epimerase
VLPTVKELLGGVVGSRDIRPVSPADLLGRREIDTDIASIAGYLTGRRVLVTGAGGSIGAELCRQVGTFGPEQLVMLDRDESALHAVELSLHGRALLDRPNLVIADIRDGERIDEVFAAWRPDVVFHAAALKHLPLLEMHPAEAVKTNVSGTQNVLEASLQHGVERFVNISTDKAANPISVLGYSKRIAERLTAGAGAMSSSGSYLSVRFGNVLGTRGSVLGTFQAQIASGGPVTVTHPEVERYLKRRFSWSSRPAESEPTVRYSSSTWVNPSASPTWRGCSSTSRARRSRLSSPASALARSSSRTCGASTRSRTAPGIR